uniref:YrhK domain-containing protein n=1 Tax=Haptolina ericina TaxID=156174 RepID=A0A7S3F151_9EUKA
MAEALSVGSHLEEMVIQTMYIVGCLSFTVGTIFYFPHIGKAVGHPGEEAGGWLFTLGSLLFVLACFVNGIYTVHGSPAGYGGFAMACRLVQTNSAMLGSCGFLVGSFLFVPEVEHGCPTQTITIATWLFFGSSVLLVLSGLLVLFGPRPSRASSLSISADSSALQALGSSPAAGGAGQKGPSTAVELTNAAHAGGPL